MRIVSGMRPTGKLHLGHYLGVLKNWINLIEGNQSFFFVADWHAISTSYEDGLHLRDLSFELVKDWLSCGVDSSNSTIFIQSAIKEHAELYLLLNMITPIGWLERNPTYKDQLQQLSNKDINTAGFLTYPVLQAVDIIIYDADFVPVGEDQRPHIEIAREIVRRFNYLYKKELFKEPKELLSHTPKLSGLDGRKMSKSYNNSIYLTDTQDEIWEKLRGGVTDPKRVKKSDAGEPEVCLLFSYHKELSSDEVIKKVEDGCRNALIGCIECKKLALASIENLISPIREKRATLRDNEVVELIYEGNSTASEIAQEKLEIVRDSMFAISN